MMFVRATAVLAVSWSPHGETSVEGICDVHEGGGSNPCRATRRDATAARRAQRKGREESQPARPQAEGRYAFRRGCFAPRRDRGQLGHVRRVRRSDQVLVHQATTENA